MTKAKSKRPDKGLTAVQQFLRDEAEKAKHFICVICGARPPVHPYGACDVCEMELGVGG